MFPGERPIDKLVDFHPEDPIGRLIVHYFFPADFLYRDYCRVSKALAAQKRRTRWRASEQMCYQRLWLAALFTVAEGFQSLGLQNKEIQDLLRSPYLNSLRHFRNGTFHYQENPGKHVQFFLDGTTITDDRLEWARELHKAIDRFHWSYRQETISRNTDALVQAWREQEKR
jgi:hypothetical protein